MATTEEELVTYIKTLQKRIAKAIEYLTADQEEGYRGARTQLAMHALLGAKDDSTC